MPSRLLKRGPPPHPDVLQIPTPPLQQEALFIIFFFPAWSLCVFGLRAYSRLSTRQWGLDDLLCGLAVLFAILMTPPLYMFIKLGYFGWRAVDVPEDFDLQPGRWWNFLMQMFYNPVLALVKASILVFLLRLSGQQRRVRLAIYGLNIFNACHAIAVFFAALFQCLPIEANWNSSARADPSTKCIDNSFHVIASCITIFSDILVLVLPFWIFLGLNMPIAAKLAVIGVFLMGSAATAVAVVRVINIYKLFFVTPPAGADPFYGIGPVYSSVEVNLAILSASIPALRPLFRRWMPTWFGGASKKTISKGYHATYGNGTLRNRTGVREGDDVTLRNMRSRAHATEIRGASPIGSEEEIMTYNGIIRTTKINVQYDWAASVSEAPSSSDYKSGEKPAQGVAF